MRLSQFVNAFPNLYKTKVPVVLKSPPGIGKSETINSLPSLMSKFYKEQFGLVTIHATVLDAPDVLGILMPMAEANGEQVAKYSEPHIMRLVRKTGKARGILFIDEIGQADHLVQKALAPLFAPNERRIGEHFLPDGWFVIGASNRTEDRSGVAKELSHFINRQCQINIDANIDDWTDWADTHGIHPMLVGFAQFRPGVVMTNEVPARPGPYCTPRSFTFVASYMNNMVDSKNMVLPNDPVTQSVISGYIGDAAAAELFAYLKVHEFLPDWEDIVSDPAKCKTPPLERLDAAYAVSNLLSTNVDEQTLEPVFTYMLRMPKELQTATARKIIQRIGGKALMLPMVEEFIKDNKALIINSIQ